MNHNPHNNPYRYPSIRDYHKQSIHYHIDYKAVLATGIVLIVLLVGFIGVLKWIMSDTCVTLYDIPCDPHVLLSLSK